MAFNELEVLDRIDIGAGQFIRIALVDTGNGRIALDIRRWWTDDEGEERPTTKGVSIGAKSVAKVHKAVEKAMQSKHFSIPIAVATATPAAAATPAKKAATPAKAAASTKKVPASKRVAATTKK